MNRPAAPPRGPGRRGGGRLLRDRRHGPDHPGGAVSAPSFGQPAGVLARERRHLDSQPDPAGADPHPAHEVITPLVRPQAAGDPLVLQSCLITHVVCGIRRPGHNARRQNGIGIGIGIGSGSGVGDVNLGWWGRFGSVVVRVACIGVPGGSGPGHPVVGMLFYPPAFDVGFESVMVAAASVQVVFAGGATVGFVRRVGDGVV
ncbi:MAG: hypothetical protein ACRDQI_12815 [Pseudonocardiaceae bacterium]